MNSRRFLATTLLAAAFGALAGIVIAYRRWVHVNPTTVALTLVLFVLTLAAQWELRYAIAVSVVATAAYNFYFLPPVGTFTISDPENWLALFAFLGTSIVGSRLSQKARGEAATALRRQRTRSQGWSFLTSGRWRLRSPVCSQQGATKSWFRCGQGCVRAGYCPFEGQACPQTVSRRLEAWFQSR